MSNPTFGQIVKAARAAMAEFALARIAEEEAAAAAAYDDLYDAEVGSTGWATGTHDHVTSESPYTRFVRSRSPEQAIRQCQVYRTLVTMAVEVEFDQTLRLILLTWMDHPDYRKEWKP